MLSLYSLLEFCKVHWSEVDAKSMLTYIIKQLEPLYRQEIAVEIILGWEEHVATDNIKLHVRIHLDEFIPHNSRVHLYKALLTLRKK